MNRRSAPLTIALAIILMAGTFMDAQAQSTFVEKVEVSEEMVIFHTQEGAFADVTMTVAGPDEYWMEHRFSGKERPSLRIKNEKGMTLPDGAYTIEMTASPNISDRQRKALNEARQKGDRYQLRQMMKEMGLNPGALVYSVNLGVTKGMFVNPESEREPEEDMGAVEQAPSSSPQIESVELTGRRWDAAYLPSAPDATGSAQHIALPAVAPGEAPPFAQDTADPASAWYEATFQNTAADGTPLTYQGFLRPVVTDTEGKLFQVYLRKTDGLVEGTWQQGYFRADEGVFHTANHAHAAQPFDYVTEEDTEDAEASMPIWHTGAGTIDGSLCIGNDCPATPAFGFDTLRLQENNLRLHFDDTSTTASFPPNDWRVYANDSANGGSSYFGVEDATAGRFVFRVFAGARSNALTVDSQGDVGLGTTTPATDIDIKIGDTPTLRLQQDGTSGFTPQTWDVAGNEAGFFIRDATGGSTLPLRIRPGAPSSAIDVAGSGGSTTAGDVGIGESSPERPLHITRNGASAIRLENTSTGQVWDVNNGGASQFRISDPTSGVTEFVLENTGNLTITGDFVTGGSGTCAPPNPACDGVFLPDYELPSIEEHAASMWKNQYLPAIGPTPQGEPINVTTKTQGILNELETAHIYIEQLHKRLLTQQQNAEQQQKTIEALQARLEALEAAQEK